MLKLLTVLLLSTLSLSLSARDGKYLNLNAFLDAKTQLPDSQAHDLDIAYHQINPQYEESPDPNKHLTVEFFFSEYDSTLNSKNKLQWIKELIDEDKSIAKEFQFEALASGPSDADIERSHKVQEIIERLDIDHIKYETIPQGLFKTSALDQKEKNSRDPSSLSDPRNFWTLIRMTSSTGAVSISLIVMEGVSPGVAAVAGFFPGLASAGVTYFSGHYGNWLTNGKWANWLIESESLLAKNMRKGMQLSASSFIGVAEKTKEFLSPNYYAQMAKALQDHEALSPEQRATRALSNVFSKIRTAEEYVKWWIADVAFTVISIKTPQVLLGLNEFTGVAQMLAEGAIAGTMGTLAQGPGDLAIQVRKYQMMEELAKDIKAGKIANEPIEVIHGGKKLKKTLLEEVEMVLTRNGEFSDYMVNRHSHRHLQKIENWARSRATMLSFFSVAGVGMEVAGIPLARPLLISIGIGGAVYYAQVNRWVELKVPQRLQQYYARLSDKLAPLSMRSLFARYCQRKFVTR